MGILLLDIMATRTSRCISNSININNNNNNNSNSTKSNLYEGVSNAVGSFITQLLAHHVVVLIWNYPWG